MNTGTEMPGGSNTSRIARSAGSVSIAVFFSRILGLVREQVLAGLFGAGTAMDAFVVAFRIPNLLRDLFAEGALSSAFVTVFTEYDEKRSQAETWFLVNNVLTALAIIISIIVLLGMGFSEELVRLLAPDFALVPGKIALTQRLTNIMFPFLLLVSLAALFMGLLNTKGYFFIPALASSCFNLGSIVIGGGLALFLPRYGYQAITGMAIGTLSGGLFQLLIQVPLAGRLGYRFRPRLNLAHPGLRRVGRLVIPAIIGLSATQINIFVNTNFASRCAEGSVAWLNYAFRLIQFPIGLFGVALSVATLPVVARQAATGNRKELGHTLVSSLNLAFALTVPAAAGLWVLAEPVVRIIFEHGRFTGLDTIMTAQAVRFYAIGLLAYSAVKILVPVFYALNDTRWPVIGSFVAVAANIVVILATLQRFQHRAIALSTSITMILNFLLLALVLYRKIGGFPAIHLLKSLMKIVLAAGTMAVVVNVAMNPSNTKNGLLLLAEVGKLILIGVFTYSVVGLVLNIEPFRKLFFMLISRMKKG